jgi:hypothetical protein
MLAGCIKARHPDVRSTPNPCQESVAHVHYHGEELHCWQATADNVGANAMYNMMGWILRGFPFMGMFPNLKEYGIYFTQDSIVECWVIIRTHSVPP